MDAFLAEPGTAHPNNQAMDYCATPEELRENPNAPELFLKIAAGNDDALRWMWSLWCFTHVIDDLVDRDKPVSGEVAARELCRFVTQIGLNPFFRDNAAALTALLVSSINRWVLGDEMAASEIPEHRTMARAVRCGDVDVFLHVAYLVGGWDHMRAMSALIDFDKGA